MTASMCQTVYVSNMTFTCLLYTVHIIVTSFYFCLIFCISKKIVFDRTASKYGKIKVLFWPKLHINIIKTVQVSISSLIAQLRHSPISSFNYYTTLICKTKFCFRSR